ncbi:MAG TPA: tetratricopeptide repeat protein [Pyrinomonadaceae bacterium]|nr:tetratricopeptide repeat protein [Pyrinomonadaceae bacterium]
MIKRNKIGAAALVAALLLTPFAPVLAAAARDASRMAAAQQEPDIPSDAEQAMFTKGQNLYNQGRYDQAAVVLQDFLKTYPRSIITDLTLLWLGRSYMQLGKLPEAEQVGARLKTIKDTPFADIYEGELETARAEASSRPQTARTAPTPKAIPVATPTPTPRTARNTTGTQTPTTTAGTTTSTQAGRNTQQQARGGTPTPTPTPAPTPVEIARTDPAMTTSRRNTGRDRRVQPRQSRTQPESTAGQTVPSSVQVVNNSNASTTRIQPRTDLTSGNTSRTTTTPVMQPTPRPTPTPTPDISTPPVQVARNTTPSVSQPEDTTPLSPSGGLTVTVKQVPNLVLALRSNSEFAQPGQSIQIPLTVRNTGNKADQFRLETDLPAEFQPTFNLAQSGGGAELPVLVTPQLAPGTSADVTLNLRVPETANDGQTLKFFVRAASQADYQVLKVADGSINVVAASLAGTSNVSSASVMPGDTFTQTISIRNAGSSPARATRADFVLNPNFELVSANPAPINYDRASRTAIWSLGDLGARSTRDISVTLRAVPDALANSSTLGRGALRTQSLPFGSNFDSPSITVGKVPKARIDAVSVGLTTTPGDTIFVPFVVRNPGNAPDSYDLRVTAPGAPQATVYADTNGDGQHQESEPVVGQTGQIEPRGGQYPLLLRVQIPASTPDRQQFSYNVVARSLSSNREASEANTVLTVATPRVRVRTEQASDSTAPGDSIFYRLVLVNEGSGLAKNLSVVETLPDALEFVNSDPSLNTQDAPGANQRFTWRVAELAPGDTAVLRVAVRLRPNLPADATLTTRHTLSYQDTNQNNYSGQ